MICDLNSQKVRDEITYQKFHDDKESYWFSHVLTSSPYHFVPGYCGGIGPIYPYWEKGAENLRMEQVGTLQLLHVLGSTQEPLWFNGALVRDKEAGDAEYIVPEGWVGHDGPWTHSRRPNFRNEFCVKMPEGGRDRMLGLWEPVNRVEGEFMQRLEKIVHLAQRYDGLMEEGLISIAR
jgi:hypothetical protein